MSKDKRVDDEFTSGSFEFDATAQAVAITAGAQVQGGTTGASAGPKTGVQAAAQYVNGMATFVHAKGGLMVEFSTGGRKFTFEPI